MSLPRDGFLSRQIQRSSRNGFFLCLLLVTSLAFFIWLSYKHFDGEGKWWLLVCTCGEAVCLFFLYKHISRLKNPEVHPLVRQLAKDGPIDRIASSIESEIQNPDMQAGALFLTKSWIVVTDIFVTNVVPLSDVVWMHGKTESTNGIKRYSVVFYRRTGHFFQCASNKENMPVVLEAVSKRIPWAVMGYSPEIIRFWNSDKAAFVKQVDQRRIDIGDLVGHQPEILEPAQPESRRVTTEPKKSFLKRFPAAQKIVWAACVAIVPLVIAFGLTKTHYRLEKRINDAIVKGAVERKETPPDLPAGFLTRMCADSEYEGENFCIDDSRILLSRQILMWSAVAGTLLFLFISLIGLVGRLGRNWLVVSFGIGIYVSLVAGALLLLASGLALTYTVYIAEVVYGDSYHPQFVILCGLIAVGGAFALIKPAFQMTQKAHSFVIGKRLTPEEYPSIWAFVRQAASRLNALVPDNIIIGAGTQFYVTESIITCLKDKLKGRTLFLSLPMMRLLGKSELLAIVGHELGHFRGSDTMYSQKFYPIYKSAHQGLESLRLEDGSPNFFALPVYALFAHFMDEFARIETGIGRQRELLADMAGAELTSDAIAASALTKVYAYSDRWNTVENKIFHLARNNQQLKNCSQFFVEHVSGLNKDELIKNLSADHKISHPTDTHPPLEIRLKQLGAGIEDCARLLERPEESAAAMLLENRVEALESELNDLEYARAFHIVQPKPAK